MCAALLRAALPEWHVALQCFGCRERFARPVIHMLIARSPAMSEGCGWKRQAPRENASRFVCSATDSSETGRRREILPFIRPRRHEETDEKETFLTSYFPPTSEKRSIKRSMQEVWNNYAFSQSTNVFLSAVTTRILVVSMYKNA